MDEWTAYHEAGHMLVGDLQGGLIVSATIAPDRDDGPLRYGDVQIAWPQQKWTVSDLARRQALTCLAGPVAEMIYRQEPLHPGFVREWESDWRMAWDCAANFHRDQQLRLRWLEQATAKLHQQLFRDDHWDAVAALADRLLAHEQLESEDVVEILDQWRP